MSDYIEHPELPPAQHERSDVPPRPFAMGLALVGVALLLTGLLVLWLFPRSIADKTVSGEVPNYAAPRLQADPRADMAAFFRDEMQRLNGVWWVERAAGRVHIPIGEAMRRVAQDGIPDWPTAPAEATPRDPTIRNGSPSATMVQTGPPR